jgi:steroid delta-isomerase-like uncharacterized protein
MRGPPARLVTAAAPSTTEGARSVSQHDTAVASDLVQARIRLVDEHVQAEVDHDIEAIMRTWGRDPWFDDVPWDEQSYGRDDVRAHYVELLKAFPDLGIDVVARHVTEDGVFLETIVHGTHTGQWRDLPPLGRRMESRVMAMYWFDEDEMLKLERTYYDKAKVLEQLGIFQDPRTPVGKVMAVITPPFTIVKALVRKVLRR